MWHHVHQADAPIHKSVVVMAANHEYSFKIVQHLPYSLDLAPSDFNLSPCLKWRLAETHYTTNDDVISMMNDLLQLQDNTLFGNGIKAQQRHWKKCVDLQGSYVEKLCIVETSLNCFSLPGSKIINHPSYLPHSAAKRQYGMFFLFFLFLLELPAEVPNNSDLVICNINRWCNC